MANAAWGTKRVCPSCGARYYDLNKTEIVCPKCDTPWTSGRGRPPAGAPKASPATARKEAQVDEVAEDIDVELEDADIEEEEEDLMEDADDLGEDDEDMAEVMDNVDDADDKP